MSPTKLGRVPVATSRQPGSLPAWVALAMVTVAAFVSRRRC